MPNHTHLASGGSPESAPVPGASLLDDSLEKLAIIIKFIFSWVILMPIAVISGGKFLSANLKLDVKSEQLFRIRIPRVFTIQATGAEVILGFSGLLISLLAIGVPFGESAYELFRQRFGTDPGHFQSLVILSSFATVLWSFLLHVSLGVIGYYQKQKAEPLQREHAKLIEGLSRAPSPAPGKGDADGNNANAASASVDSRS